LKAIVAIGTVVMVLVFVAIEVNAVHLGAFPIVLENNTNTIDVQRTAASEAGLRHWRTSRRARLRSIARASAG
jgi:hypothetical protein